MPKSTFILLVLILTFSCKENSQEIIACIGDQTISKNSFIESFTLQPEFQNNSILKDAYKQHLDYMIEQVYLSQAAKESKMDTLSEIKSKLKYIYNKELLKELYREEIARKITISDNDAWDEYKKQNFSVGIRHLFATSKEQIELLKNDLDRGVSFNDLAKISFTDTTLANNGGYLGFLKLTDFDPYLVDSLYNLQIGIPSGILKSSRGYHIFRVDEIKQNTILDKEYFQANTDFFKDEVVKRKSKIMSDDFVRRILIGKEVTINRPALEQLLQITRKFIKERPQQMVLMKITVTDSELGLILNEIDLIQNKVLVSFSDGNWTVRQFLEKLKEMPPLHRPSLAQRDILVEQIIDMVRDSYLLKEAQRQSLDTTENFIIEYEKYRTQILANKYQRLIQQARYKNENPELWALRKQNLDKIKATVSVDVDSFILYDGLSAQLLQQKVPRVYTVIREQYVW